MLQCPLCLRLLSKNEIRLSHIIPRFCFRQMLKRRGAGNIVKSDGFPSQKQYSEYMLCQECEERMQVGENYFRSICYDLNGDCPLYSMASYKSPVNSLSYTGSPYRKNIKSLDKDKLKYFAISVFWRTAVSKKMKDYELESARREACRRYLMGIDIFPENISVRFVVIDQPRNAQDVDFIDLYAFPWRSSKYKDVFIACGFLFRMYHETIPSNNEDMSDKKVLFQAALSLPEVLQAAKLVQDLSDSGDTPGGGE